MFQLRRKNSWCLAVIFFIIIFSFSVSAVRINEVELNPEGDDSGFEWIELYSQEEANLTGYSIKNNDNQTINLTGVFSGFLIVNFSGQWLNNEDEKVFLFFNSSKIDETIILKDSSNDNKTWQYCNDNWNFTNSTKRLENLCQENQAQQNTTQTAEIYLELEYDEKVENGEFKIKVRAFNLKSKNYDVKVYIIDGEDIISDTYNEDEEKWKSSTYFANDFLNGTGNKSKTLKLRINEENFTGNAEIMAKIREGGETSIIDEYSGDIGILKVEDSTVTETGENSENTEANGTESQIKVIKLNSPKSIKSQDGGEYKSKTEYIKEYAIYIFAAFCVFVIILMIIKRKM